MPLQLSLCRFVRVERGARLVMRGQQLMARVLRAVQAVRRERSFISRSPLRYKSFSLLQAESGESSLIDGLSHFVSFRQANSSSMGSDPSTEMSVTEESMIRNLVILEQEANGERSERRGALSIQSLFSLIGHPTKLLRFRLQHMISSIILHL